MGLYIMPLTVHTTLRSGMGQRTGLETNGLHTPFPIPGHFPVPGPVCMRHKRAFWPFTGDVIHRIHSNTLSVQPLL